MTISMSMCQQACPMLDIPTRRLRLNPRWQKEKVVIIMGTTGTGKSRLSIDLATQFPAEIINSDKMQVYEGLDIVTNKIPEEEKHGIPHHLLGVINPNMDFTKSDFCEMASQATESILMRGLLPIIVGGSNSYIEALVDGHENEHYGFQSKYDCCFLWVDVSLPVLHDYVSKRVDQMVNNGMVDEVREIFDVCADYSHGIRKSIGVPELDTYFRKEPFLDEENGVRLLHQAICEIKYNNCKLACRQREKIHRLKYAKGWNIHRIDATEVFCKRRKKADEAWEMLVTRPSTAILRQFLYSLTTAKAPAATTTVAKYIAQWLAWELPN